MEHLHISGALLAAGGSLLSALLGIVAFFLSRLVKKFDELTGQVSTLNDTMKRIDKDLSGEVGILKEKQQIFQQELGELDQLWDRVRITENNVTALQRGGCEQIKRCAQ